MGICESTKKIRRRNKLSHNKGKQPYSAPIKDYINKNNDTTNLGNTFNTISQNDLMSNNDLYKRKPSKLYKYNSIYRKKGEQLSLMTMSLHEMQGNSLNAQSKYSRNRNTKNNNSLYNSTCIDETENESSNEVIEIIYDGKMDENMIQKSTDKTTINSYNEFIGKKENIPKKNNIDIYNRKKSVKKNSNGKTKKNEESNDGNSALSDIPRKPIKKTINEYKN